MGLLRLEMVTTYFSDQVVAGFTTGASCHVFAAQLKDLFGLTNLPNRSGPANFFFVSNKDAVQEIIQKNSQSLKFLQKLVLYRIF